MLGLKNKHARYRKLSLIGRGTFGTVHLVEADGEKLVMKEVSLQGLPRKEQRATMNEVRVLQALKHKHIVRYRDSFVVPKEEKLCIVLEWASGGDLAAYIARHKTAAQPIAEAQVLMIIRQICSALSYCHHELKLLHRDIKPANVFLDERGDVKLGDFGISKLLPLSEALAHTQCGTPLYMSPEMARGDPYTRAADAWAVGCLLYEMMSLQAPWIAQLGPKAAAEGVAGLMRVVRTEKLCVDGLRSRYSDELCALLCALTARNPGERPTFSSILQWPLMQGPTEAALHNRSLRPAQQQQQINDSRIHIAAQAIQRSFRGSFSRQQHRPAPRWRCNGDNHYNCDGISMAEATIDLNEGALPQGAGGAGAVAAAAFARRAAAIDAAAARGAVRRATSDAIAAANVAHVPKVAWMQCEKVAVGMRPARKHPPTPEGHQHDQQQHRKPEPTNQPHSRPSVHGMKLGLPPGRVRPNRVTRPSFGIRAAVAANCDGNMVPAAADPPPGFQKGYTPQGPMSVATRAKPNVIPGVQPPARCHGPLAKLNPAQALLSAPADEKVLRRQRVASQALLALPARGRGREQGAADCAVQNAPQRPSSAQSAAEARTKATEAAAAARVAAAAAVAAYQIHADPVSFAVGQGPLHDSHTQAAKTIIRSFRRVLQARHAAAAAQKIIDSFKRSQQRRLLRKGDQLQLPAARLTLNRRHRPQRAAPADAARGTPSHKMARRTSLDQPAIVPSPVNVANGNLPITRRRSGTAGVRAQQHYSSMARF